MADRGSPRDGLVRIERLGRVPRASTKGPVLHPVIYRRNWDPVCLRYKGRTKVDLPIILIYGRLDARAVDTDIPDSHVRERWPVTSAISQVIGDLSVLIVNRDVRRPMNRPGVPRVRRCNHPRIGRVMNLQQTFT